MLQLKDFMPVNFLKKEKISLFFVTFFTFFNSNYFCFILQIL